MTEIPKLVEVRNWSGETFHEVWLCDPPPEGVTYIVTDDSWDESLGERTIRKIEIRP